MRFADTFADGSHFTRRHWLLILVVTLVGAAAGLVIGWLPAPAPEYQATATVRAQSSFLSGASQVVLDGQASEGLSPLSAVFSLAIAEEAARRLNMIPAIGDPDMRNAAPYLAVIQRLRHHIETRAVPGGVAITASSDRPDNAASMANTVADVYHIEWKRRRDQRWVEGKRLIEAQLAGAEQRLGEAEQDLREFQEREGPVLYAEEAKAAFDSIIWLEREQEELQRTKAEAGRLEQTSRLQGAQAQEAVLVKQLARARERYARLPKAAAQLARLERGIKVEVETYERLKAQSDRHVLFGAQQQGEQIDIEPAVAPAAPRTPLDLRWWLVGGGMMGLGLGLLGAFWRETCATSLRTIDGVQGSLNLPVLGVLPRYRERALRQRVAKRLPAGLTPEGLAVVSKLFPLGSPESPQAEGIRAVQANLEFAAGDPLPKVLTVTSVGVGEGKTLTAVNLAVSLAQEGRRVLLVDADLRRPTVHERLGLARDPGLADVLGGSVPWRSAVQSVADLLLGSLGIDQVMRAPRLDNLSILPAGSQAGSSPPMSSVKLTALLKEMREAYDLVLVDTPAILPILDGVRVSAKVDGTILVFQGGKGGFPALKRAKFLLDHARAKVFGLVLTNVGPEVLPEPGAYGYDSQ